MVDNSPMADSNNGPNISDANSATDTNALFGDFFELDLLDPADANADLFSFLLNSEGLPAMTDISSDLTTDSLGDLSTLDGLGALSSLPLLNGLSNQEEAPGENPSKSEDQDLRILLAHNLQQQQQQQGQEQEVQTSSNTNAMDNMSLVAQLVSPFELTALPPPQNLATPAASPATPTLKTPESTTISTAAATAQSKHEQLLLKSQYIGLHFPTPLFCFTSLICRFITPPIFHCHSRHTLGFV